MKALIGKVHSATHYNRRARVLARHLALTIPQNASVLDVGCGDGTLAVLLMALRPDLVITGIDVYVRPSVKIPVHAFDGTTIPYNNHAYDFVLFVDVLHHTDDPVGLMGEAVRVARQGLIVKDHLVEGLWARQTLRIMDWIGNAPYGIVLPYNYLTPQQWTEAFHALDLEPVAYTKHLHIYPFPLGLWFDRDLHFITRLQKRSRPLGEIA